MPNCPVVKSERKDVGISRYSREISMCTVLQPKISHLFNDYKRPFHIISNHIIGKSGMGLSNEVFISSLVSRKSRAENNNDE